jgi:hypothetical protein
MAGEYKTLRVVKEVTQNPNSAIRSDLDYGLGDLSSKQDRLASKTEVTQKENQLRSEMSSTTQALADQQAGLASKTEVKKITQSVQSDLANTQDATKEVKQTATSAGVKANQALRNSMDAHQQIRNVEMDSDAKHNSLRTTSQRLADALMGNLELRIDDGEADLEISAALLNAAAVDTFTKPFNVALVAKLPSGDDYTYPTHSWANEFLKVDFTLVPSEPVTPEPTDPRISKLLPESDPEGTPALTYPLSYGVFRGIATFLTDAGQTIVWVPDMTVAIKAKITATGTQPWAAVEVTKTYTVVA